MWGQQLERAVTSAIARFCGATCSTSSSHMQCEGQVVEPNRACIPTRHDVLAVALAAVLTVALAEPVALIFRLASAIILQFGVVVECMQDQWRRSVAEDSVINHWLDGLLFGIEESRKK
eukprot:CAMPEP_0183365896 /NCGR_PEP_ID=MMETSP0164_2-20130417/86438_1 /TAXON_ID=221442 /ORGANISM="Coccolithus pelagicus ssp braarudi, Strain PLY182g" /LENGTH=118 /DNA_ID=CAMNT_0025541511 /DNA_START=382 /DNA_END=738 /DNA_ORIENTATION=-